MSGSAFDGIIRRAVLDLLTDVGGEHNHRELVAILNDMGHRINHRDMKLHLAWLAENAMVEVETMGSFLVARVLEDGRDVSNGVLTVEGVSRHKTGD